MKFEQFRKRLQENFAEMVKDEQNLYTVDLDKDELWNLYLDSFPEGTNKIFRTRREYDCSNCRHFIKNIGNVVSIKDNKVRTIWDFEVGNDTFQTVTNALNEFVKSKTVNNVYFSKFKHVGIDSNLERTATEVLKWTHLNLELPSRFVETRRSLGDVQGDFRDIRNVFKRSLDEISEESVLTILELISQNSLYRGNEWRAVLNEFLKYKKEYSKLSDKEKELYAWEKASKAGVSVGKIRNHSIGTLLVNVSEGMELDLAVKKYEQIVAPANYKRPKAIFTKKMLEDAQKTVTELGYMESLPRRFATLDDITVNNILFSNRDAAKRIAGANIFEEMAQNLPVNTKKFSKVEEISIEDFINNVLPTAREIEALFENKHTTNLVSLIAPQNKDSKTMFKWNNGFSWSYSGNITDSNMKERVKTAGGKVDGVLRFTIQWGEYDQDKNDLDAHCIEPGGFEISYRDTESPRTNGQLDVDIQNPVTDRRCPDNIGIENITWANKNSMEVGTYRFFVHQFSNRGGKNGFRAEIEFNGEVYSFDYPNELKQDEKVQVAEVTLYENGTFSIKEILPSSVSSRNTWGIDTNQFIPVTTVMYSPNYWDEQKGIGNKHYFFMLKDCINDERPNGFFNEFIKPELEKHKRVFEALGGKMAVEDVEDQLSGLGFSSTKRNELVVKVKGSTERVLKIKF